MDPALFHSGIVSGGIGVTVDGQGGEITTDPSTGELLVNVQTQTPTQVAKANATTTLYKWAPLVIIVLVVLFLISNLHKGLR